jgi:hypothetical protein
MAFDGEWVTEGEFETVEEAWEHANDMGSRWFFYPFRFVTTSKTIKDAPSPIEWMINKRIKTISECFNKTSKSESAQHMDADEFARLMS